MPDFSRFTGKINFAMLTEWEISIDANGEEYFKYVRDVDKSIMQEHLNTQISKQHDAYIPNANPPQGFYGMYGYKQSVNDLTPRTSVIEVPRETVKNLSFNKRKALGEIIVSPMKVGKLVITETPYLVKSSKSYADQQDRYLHADPTIPTKTLGDRTCGIINGKFISGSWFADAERHTNGVYDYMPFDKSRYIKLMSSGEIDKALVTDTAASLNEATLDLLTTLAELPETVKMVHDVLGFAGNKVKAFRTAEKQLKRKLLRQGVPRSELESADAFASLWLQWRYGIMPVYYTLQDIKNVLKDKFAAEYVKESKTKNIDFDLEEGFKGAATCVSSCWMKRRFDPNDKSAQFRRVFGVNPFVTAWELTTLSFVVDWFINVGDAISALTPIPSLEEKATFSWKNSVKGIITKPNYPQGIVEIDLSYYEITPINYQDFVSLNFEPVLTAKRKIDALALSWSFSRSFFRKFK